MARQRKIDNSENNRKNGKDKIKKAEPLTDRENPVRTLVYGGAFIRTRLTDSEFIDTLKRGELGKSWKIKREPVPEVVGIVNVEGLGILRISLEIGSAQSNKPASEVLSKAGVSEKTVEKVREIEGEIESGKTNDFCIGPALGGIEDAFIRKRKEEDEK